MHQIGSGNYFWSYPSKLSQSRKRKLSEVEKRKQTLEEKIAKAKQAIETQQSMRTESVGRLIALGAHETAD